MAAPTSVRVDVEGKELTLTNLEKVLYPAAGFTKAQVIAYYQAISPALLAHLRGRALTLKRYPNGVDAAMFFQKNVPEVRPPWIKVVDVPIGRGTTALRSIVVDDLPSLIWVANLAALELHPLLSDVEDLTKPTVLAFDLDPGPDTNVATCARVALHIRDLLEPLGLSLWPKTSGSKGMQVYCPLRAPVSFAQTKTFSRAVAQLLERRLPELVTSTMTKSARTGKVFVDWSQNDAAKTTVAAYSLRAMARPTVSTPLSWAEVERCADSGEVIAFTAGEVVDRVEQFGELFAPVVGDGAALPDLGLT